MVKISFRESFFANFVQKSPHIDGLNYHIVRRNLFTELFHLKVKVIAVTGTVNQMDKVLLLIAITSKEDKNLCDVVTEVTSNIKAILLALAETD